MSIQYNAFGRIGQINLALNTEEEFLDLWWLCCHSIWMYGFANDLNLNWKIIQRWRKYKVAFWRIPYKSQITASTSYWCAPKVQVLFKKLTLTKDDEDLLMLHSDSYENLFHLHSLAPLKPFHFCLNPLLLTFCSLHWFWWTLSVAFWLLKNFFPPWNLFTFASHRPSSFLPRFNSIHFLKIWLPFQSQVTASTQILLSAKVKDPLFQGITPSADIQLSNFDK